METPSEVDRTRSEGPAPTRVTITATLAVLGGLLGLGAGFLLTILGNKISGYPLPPSTGAYLRNMTVFGVAGAAFAPPLAWGVLRTAPLWRAIAEPAFTGVLGAGLGMILAPSFFPLFALAGAAGGVLHLRRVFPEDSAESPPAELVSSSAESS